MRIVNTQMPTTGEFPEGGRSPSDCEAGFWRMPELIDQSCRLNAWFLEGTNFMVATILDGKAISKEIRAELKQETAAFVEAHGVQPALAAVLVGEDPASEVYAPPKISPGAYFRVGAYFLIF